MTLRVDASIGIALAPGDARTVDTLLQRADVAMYTAKLGHRSFDFYSLDRDLHTRERLELMTQVREALERRQLVLHYQPQLDIALGAVTGVEALVRWEHPSRGLLYPDSFLSLFDQSGLMGTLATYVLDRALEQKARLAREGIDVTVAVNFSATELNDELLPQKVALALSRAAVDPAGLVIEITEDFLMLDAARGRATLNQLRDLGVELSIDDYGTGFSSLAYLRDLPVHELKIDRDFLTEVESDPRSRVIIGSTVELAHSLGLRVVAEGVETARALAVVGELGCDIAQGYYIARPAPVEQLRLQPLRPPSASSPTSPARTWA